MSIISAGVTTTTSLVQTGNIDGTLQLQVNGTTPSVTLATTGAVGVGSVPSYGTAGQVLTSQGSGAAPTWSTGGGGSSISQGNSSVAVTDSGSNGQIAFTTEGAQRALIDTSGNLGLGVAPSFSWTNTANAALQVKNVSFSGIDTNDLHASSNAYFVQSASQWRYLASGSAASNYYQSAGTHVWRTAPSGTAGNAVTFTQVLAVEGSKSLALQGATPQTGTGITFPATQSASTDANTLDDYEEGTFTPSYSATGATFAYAYRVGFYTKIGNKVFVELFLRTNSVSGGSGDVLITGLPFPVVTMASNQSPQGGAVLFSRNFASNFPSAVTTGGVPNTTSLFLWYRTSASGALDAVTQASSLGTGSDGNWLTATLFYTTT